MRARRRRRGRAPPRVRPHAAHASAEAAFVGYTLADVLALKAAQPAAKLVREQHVGQLGAPVSERNIIRRLRELEII